MAIYQFYLAVIPKVGIEKYFGKIPKKLQVDFQMRTENFLNEESDEKFDYIDYIKHKCWELAKVNSIEIINLIDQKLDRADWGNDKESNNWKTEAKEVDNDAWIFTHLQNNQIIEFTFRADLREPKLKFLIEMIELSKSEEFLLVDNKGNLVKPEIGNVIELVKKSNALRFVENPINFLSDLEEGKIELE